MPKTLKHLKRKPTMDFKQEFLMKWNELYRKKIGFYEPIISLKKLFKEA